MVMSQGTYTFLACFAGFWLIWAAVVMFCCFCNFLQRRLKCHRDKQIREQCLRSVETEHLSCSSVGYMALPPAPPPPLQLPREPHPQVYVPPPPMDPPLQTTSPVLPLMVPHPLPQATWVSLPEVDAVGKPPCYEEAVLMEDPPPPYSEVLADPRGGTFLKPGPLRSGMPPVREHHDPAVSIFSSETRKLPAAMVFPDRAYSSLIRLPSSSQRWDSLGHLLSNIDLSHSSLTPPLGESHAFQMPGAIATATMPRREHRTQQCHGGFQLESTCGLPTAFPLLGRSTAV